MLPIVISPLSKPEASDVTVCVMPSLFVQVTVVPTDTVSVAGVKDIFTILTALATGGGVVVLLLPYPLLLLQEMTAIKEISSKNIFGCKTLIFIKAVCIEYAHRESIVAQKNN